MAFLAAMVGPKVAAAAAQAALESLSAEEPSTAQEAANGVAHTAEPPTSEPAGERFEGSARADIVMMRGVWIAGR